MSEAEARAIAARLPGISVRRWKSKGTWEFEARYHLPGGKWIRRYAGQSLRLAVDLRIELMNTYGSGASEQSA